MGMWPLWQRLTICSMNSLWYQNWPICTSCLVRGNHENRLGWKCRSRSQGETQMNNPKRNRTTGLPRKRDLDLLLPRRPPPPLPLPPPRRNSGRLVAKETLITLPLNSFPVEGRMGIKNKSSGQLQQGNAILNNESKKLYFIQNLLSYIL